MRKIMKKILNKLSLLFCFLFLMITLSSPIVLATEGEPIPEEQPSEGVYFVISNETAIIGEQVIVSIVNYSGLGVTSGQFKVSYDADRFELVDNAVFGDKPISFNQQDGEFGSIEVMQFLMDASNPYQGEVIAQFTFVAKGNLSGIASFGLEKAVIGQGSIGGNVQRLEVINNAVSLEIVNEEADDRPSDPGTVITEPTDVDEPIIPTETEYLEPEPEEPSEESTTTTPTETETETETQTETQFIEDEETPTTEESEIETEINPTSTTKPTESTAETSKTEESTTSQTETKPSQSKSDDIKITVPQEQGDTVITENTQTTMQTIKLEVLEQQETANTVDNNQQQEETSLSEEVVLQNNVTEKKTTTTSAKILKQEETTTTRIEPTTENSENIKTNEQKLPEEKQAKQEQAFKLTEKDSEIDNKVIIGGLALISVSSMIALGFMIFQNHIKPR